MLFLKLFYTFFTIGLFSFGGGYSMFTILQSEIVYDQGWMSSAEFANAVALGQMTPGPLCVNTATYCGYTAVRHAGMGEWMGVLGSATATLGLILPSLILVVLVCRFFMRYMNTIAVQSVMNGLHPAVVGLMAAAALMMMNRENFSSVAVNPWQFWISIFIFAAVFVGTRIMRINPIRMIGWAAFAGLMLLY